MAKFSPEYLARKERIARRQAFLGGLLFGLEIVLGGLAGILLALLILAYFVPDHGILQAPRDAMERVEKFLDHYLYIQGSQECQHHHPSRHSPSGSSS